MVAMMAGRHPTAGTAVAEAQASAIQAIIQANYQTFLTSKHSASLVPGVWEENHAHEHAYHQEREYAGEKVEFDDKHMAPSAQSEREAFERIFMGERSVSGGSGQNSAHGGAKMSIGGSDTGSSRTSNDGTGVAAASACGADEEKRVDGGWMLETSEWAFVGHCDRMAGLA
jgi:hypothetical protein